MVPGYWSNVYLGGVITDALLELFARLRDDPANATATRRAFSEVD